ncbi:MAG: class I SAM-dependent methyltransferase, partial [Planctomycetaceae bacterium]
VKRVFEPACGTGRLLIKLAQSGFDVSGNDLNTRAVNYCNDRLERHGFTRSALTADMSDFRLRQKVDASFNMINSFRHLLTEKQAVAHLQCMADATRSGGLYVLGLHLIPASVDDRVQDEGWSASRGTLTVNTYMWSKGIDSRKRAEILGLTIDVWTPTKHMQIEDEMIYRTYSAPQMMTCLKKVPAFEIVETFDFAYEPDHPIKVDSRTEDVVFVLRKK